MVAVRNCTTLSVNRPSDGTSNAIVFTVEPLQDAYDSKRFQLRNATLGADAKMLDYGYVDTKNGCVMTSATVLDLMPKRWDELKFKKNGRNWSIYREK